MIIKGERFREVYAAVSGDKHQSDDKTILVFVANADVDAVCSVRSLTHIFESDESNFSERPVESYNEIREACLNQRDTDELRTIFLINCGATENARHACGIGDNENVRLIIIDSHRPIWHGYNDYDTNTLVLLDADDPVPLPQLPQLQPGDHQLRAGDVAGYLRATGGALRGGGGSGDDSDGEGGDGGGASPSSPKRRRTERLDEAAKQRRVELDAYYSEKCGFGKPSALLLYDLCMTQGVATMHTLWLAVLGLTDQLVHQRCSRDDYERWRRALEAELQRLGVLTDTTNETTRLDTLTVSRITDMRLSLLTHWSLVESLQATGYTASRMQTWSEKGRGNVKLMLATMRVDLNNAKAQYSVMEQKYKRDLPTLLQKHGPTFGLNLRSHAVEGFELRYKSDTRLSATDAVTILALALARPRSRESADAAADSRDAFHEAGQLLNATANRWWEHLKPAIERAKTVLQAVVTQGGLAISRKQVHGARKARFWHLNMADLEFTNKADFQHPGALMHLALFLRDAMARRTSSFKAMVVIGPPDVSDRCYVVALRRKEDAGRMQNNPFARPFEEVVENLGLDRHLDRAMFDPTLYHIRRVDAASFLEELKTIVAQYEAGARLDDALAA